MSLEEARQQDLVRRHLAGDRGALEELLLSVEPRLASLCLRMAGDPQDARDLCQESMVRIIRGLPEFGGRSRVSTWMIRVTMNVCLTARRRERIRRTVSLDAPALGRGGHSDEVGIGANLHDEGEPSAERRVEQREDLVRLTSAIGKLDPEQRALLILRDGQDLDYGEIAEILGVPVGTIKSRLFRARQALRERMEASGRAR